MKVFVGLAVLLFILYLIGILRAMHRLSKAQFMIDIVQSYLADLHPLYRRVHQLAKKSQETVSHDELNDQFVKLLQKKQLSDSLEELLSLVPDIERLHPYLVRYVRIGKEHDSLTNFQGMLQLNKFLLAFKKQAASELNIAINPLTAFLKLFRLPVILLKFFRINIQTETIAYTLSFFIWCCLAVLYYNWGNLIQSFQIFFP